MREHCFTFCPALNPFKQCAGLVPAQFTRRLRIGGYVAQQTVE